MLFTLANDVYTRRDVVTCLQKLFWRRSHKNEIS